MPEHHAPYSLRDLRSVFAGDELRALGGEYLSAERRWRFTSREQRIDAQRLLDTRPEIGVLYLPNLSAEEKRVHELGGVFIRVRSDHETKRDVDRKDKRAYKRERDFAIFSSEAEAQNALVELYQTFAATPIDLKALRDNYVPAAFAQPIDNRLEGLLPPLYADVQEWNARIAAYTKFAPRNAEAEAASRVDALDEANAVMKQMLQGFHDTPFRPMPVPEKGTVAGLTVARAPHHVAILAAEDGTGYLLPRERIAMPMRHDHSAEVGLERCAAIHVDLDTMKATQTRDLTPEQNRDIEQGPIIVATRAAAGALKPIIEMEQSLAEDLDGVITASNAAFSAILDRGATIYVALNESLSSTDIGTQIRMGPSFTASNTTRAARRSR
jgi:hypothetical protein